MKIIAAILGVMLIAISTYAGVPGEGIVVAQAVNAQTLMQKAEYHLMRIEMYVRRKRSMTTMCRPSNITIRSASRHNTVADFWDSTQTSLRTGPLRSDRGVGKNPANEICRRRYSCKTVHGGGRKGINCKNE